MKHQPIQTIKELDVYDLQKMYKQLGGRTPYGFYQYYFNELPFHRTNLECFNHVNDIYFELYGEYRYESYNSFRIQYNQHLKKQ